MNSATDYLHSIIDRIQEQLHATNIQVAQETNKDLPLTYYQKYGQSMTAPGQKIPSTHFHQLGFLKLTFDRDGVSETAYMATSVACNDKIGHSPFGFGKNSVWDNDNQDAVAGPTTFIMVPSNPNPERIKEARIIASSPAPTTKFTSFCLGAIDTAIKNGTKRLQESAIAQEELHQERRTQMMDEFRQRMDDRSANVHEFINYIQDNADYKDRHGSVWTLPNQYGYSYENGQGEVILNGDPTYNPQGGWFLLQKAGRGD